jgi:hypothetical protein
MVWFMVLQVVSTLVELVRLRHKSESEKDLEILLLRRQLAIFERKQDQPMRLSRGGKLTQAVLAAKLKAKTGRTIKQMGKVIRIVNRLRSFAGMVSWYAANGRTGSGIALDIHASTRKSNVWWLSGA